MNFIFVGYVPANKEIWVIGDSYMTFLAQHIDFWKDNARLNPHEALYILHWFDVKAFPPHSTSTNAVEVILSSLIGALNNRPKLPEILVVMLGDVKFWCEPQALRFTMDSIIKVLLKELRRILQSRQNDLPVKAQKEEPRLFFVKLNWKPDKAIDSVSCYPKKRRTFNKLLDTMVRPRGVNTILLHDINDKIDPDLFLGHGALSQKGYRQVWASLSEALHDFHVLGHQQKKTFVMEKQAMVNGEVDSPLYSSDDNLITNLGYDGSTPWNRPQAQNKRRFHVRGKQGYHQQQQPKWNKY